MPTIWQDSGEAELLCKFEQPDTAHAICIRWLRPSHRQMDTPVNYCCRVSMCESVGLGNDNAQYQKQCCQDEDDDDQIPYFFQFSSFKGKVIGECAARERQTLNGYGIRAMVRQTAQIWHPILAEQRPHPARAQSLPSGRWVHATARERYQHSKFCEKRWTAARWKPLWALREASPDARPPYAPPL